MSVIIPIVAALLLTAYLVAATRAYARARGVRVVHCPATQAPAAIHVDPVRNALRLGHPSADRVHECSLWPERRLCAQACLAEVSAFADQCAFQRMVACWYVGKHCTFCRRAIPPVRWGEPRPSLISPKGTLVYWSDVPPIEVYDVLATHAPVCASCGLAEDFRIRHPDLVIERPRLEEEGRGRPPA
jgi:hypothetical protein